MNKGIVVTDIESWS